MVTAVYTEQANSPLLALKHESLSTVKQDMAESVLCKRRNSGEIILQRAKLEGTISQEEKECRRNISLGYGDEHTNTRHTLKPSINIHDTTPQNRPELHNNFA